MSSGLTTEINTANSVANSGCRPQRTRFQIKLKKLIELSGFTQKELADRVPVDKGLLNHWLRGRNTPTPLWRWAIHRLEDELGAERYDVWDTVELKSRWGHPKIGRYVGIDDPRQIRREVVRMLTPEQMNLPQEEFIAEYNAARARLTERRDPLMTAVTRSTPVAKPPDYPAHVLEDFDRIRKLSSAKAWHVGQALLPLKQRAPGGIRMQERRIERAMRYVSGDPRGPRMSCTDLTLGLLLFPDIARVAVGAKQDRLSEITKRLYLTTEDVDVFRTGRDLVQPPTGYVFQHRDKMLKELKPLDPYITRASLAKLKKDWEEACWRAARTYESYIESYGPIAEVGVVNRKVPVEDMIDDNDPLRYLDILNERMAEVFWSMQMGAPAWVTHAADTVMARIASDTGLRNETFHQLDVTELTECSEGWKLTVPRSKIKNGDGPYFRLGSGKFRDLERVLSDANGMGEIIETYFARARPALEGASGSKALFLTRTTTDADSKRDFWPRLAPEQFARRMKDISELYLCGGSGLFEAVEGANPFTTHQCRAIVCAGTLKRFYHKLDPQEALQRAADTICDGIAVAERYYARWDGQERERRLRAPN
jgi:hypothetical protein